MSAATMLLMAACQQQRRGAALEAETTALISRFDVAPSAALLALINVTIKGLKDDGVFALADTLYIRGLHNSQAACQNWKKNAHNSTLVNSPAFTAKVGFKGDGSSSYINNNFTASTAAENLKLNSGSLAFMNSVQGTTGLYLCGSLSSTSRLRMSNSSSVNDIVTFNSTTNISGPDITDPFDMISMSRLDANNVQLYKNGSPNGAAVSNNVNRTSLPNLAWYELAYNNNGTVVYYNGNLNFTFTGGLLSNAQMLALYNRIKYFYDNVGSTF